MNEPGQVSLQGLNDCGGCAGLTASTPVLIQNRAGLSAIAYRVGTQATFRASLLAALSDATQPALAGLTTRADDDFSIALLDAWAIVCDVLTFYHERVANESYLRTATERLSLVQLARLIGYRLRPGVAASAYLAFTVQNLPGSPATTVVGQGTKVQSIPGPNETPQMFETSADIVANVAWNNLQPRLTQPQPISTAMTQLLLTGTGLKLNNGDALLIFAPDNPAGKLVRVSGVKEDTTNLQTNVCLVQQSTFKFTAVPVFELPAAIFSREAFKFDNTSVQSTILNQSWNSADLNAFANVNRLSVQELYQAVAAGVAEPPPPPPGTSVYAMRKRALLFGYNAPDWNAMSTSTQNTYDGNASTLPADWPLFSKNTATTLCLDQVYKEVKAGDWVVIQIPSQSPPPIIAQITGVTEVAASFFGISGQVTQISFSAPTNVTLASMDDLRGTSVYIVPEELTPAAIPDTSPIPANNIELSGPVPGLSVGQAILVSGMLSDVDGVSRSEAAVIQDVVLDGGYTILTLVNDLQNSYVRNTVTICANVALATNGETTSEILGGGDASQAYQRFTLKQSPLTYVPATNPDGAASTLEVFVNDVQWQETDSFFGAQPRDHDFVTRISDDGQTTLTFGDGQTGARLPTGVTNVRATYRKGIGVDGNVNAGQLSLLMTRPLGVSSVTNPVAASGGADPEPLLQARLNAPQGMLTLGRIVSLTDYEDFACAFAGIAKALATWTWDGRARGIYITAAGPEGAEITPDSQTYTQLLAAMQAAGDPRVRLSIASYTPAPFRISASLKIDPDYQVDLVTPQVEQALQDGFSFDARSFGQPVALSEVYAVILAVPGVLAAEVSALYRAGDDPTLNLTLVAAYPQPGAYNSVAPAELLTLDAVPLQFGTLT